MLASTSLTGLEAASDALAATIARSLTGADDAFSLRPRVAELGGDGIGSGAVRLLGADVLAPFVLSGRPIDPGDVEVVRAAVRAFPAPSPVPTPDPVWTARDWALRQTLTGLGVEVDDWNGLARLAVQPASAARSAPAMPPVSVVGAEAEPWQQWSVSLARLSSLALPGLDGPVRAESVARRADTMRGLARSMLRHDHLTAARLGRWLCLDRCPDRCTPVDAPLTHAMEHLTLLNPGQGRTSLELTIGSLLMERKR